MGELLIQLRLLVELSQEELIQSESIMSYLGLSEEDLIISNLTKIGLNMTQF